MHPLRKKRLIIVLFIVSGLSIAATLALYALRQNINLYYTPSQVVKGGVTKGQMIRVGGIVKSGSVHRASQGLQIRFAINDSGNTVRVSYDGVLPDLFREGQGIVVQGKLDKQGVLIADQVLAKHGAEYKPQQRNNNNDP
jgi:cytochrome c-type biogenesis protein CcmE